MKQIDRQKGRKKEWDDGNKKERGVEKIHVDEEMDHRKDGKNERGVT